MHPFDVHRVGLERELPLAGSIGCVEVHGLPCGAERLGDQRKEVLEELVDPVDRNGCVDRAGAVRRPGTCIHVPPVDRGLVRHPAHPEPRLLRLGRPVPRG